MSVDRDQYKALAASFASGVTIITSGGEGSFHAMTASAFSSLSLDPPMVLVCVDKRAHTCGIITRYGGFNVNILGTDQQALSNACARSGTPESSLEGVETTPGQLGLPIIAGSIAHLECRTVHEYDGGDHVIFVGQVEHGGCNEGQPLLYFRGKYGWVSHD